MVVLQSDSLEQFQQGKSISWKETSSWSGVQMERTGTILSISQSLSGAYLLGVDKDRSLMLIVQK